MERTLGLIPRDLIYKPTLWVTMLHCHLIALKLKLFTSDIPRSPTTLGAVVNVKNKLTHKKLLWKKADSCLEAALSCVQKSC